MTKPIVERLPITDYEFTGSFFKRNGVSFDALARLYKEKVRPDEFWTKYLYHNLNPIAYKTAIKAFDGEGLLQNNLSTYAAFTAAGKKIFRLESHLVDELCLTNVDKITADFIQLPHDSICLHIPSNKFLTSSNGKDPIKWIYITERKAPIRLPDHLVPNGEETGMMVSPSPNARVLDVLCIGDSVAGITSQVSFFNYFLIAEELKKLKESQGAYVGELADLKEVTSDNRYQLVSFIISALLYINSKDSDQTIINPNMMLSGCSKLPMCSLGRNIKINKDISGYLSSGNLDRVIHVLKWAVRGHWRKQPIGEGRQDIKTIWIRPFLKGREKDNPDMPMKPTNYEVTK